MKSLKEWINILFLINVIVAIAGAVYISVPGSSVFGEIQPLLAVLVAALFGAYIMLKFGMKYDDNSSRLLDYGVLIAGALSILSIMQFLL